MVPKTYTVQKATHNKHLLAKKKQTKTKQKKLYKSNNELSGISGEAQP